MSQGLLEHKIFPFAAQLVRSKRQMPNVTHSFKQLLLRVSFWLIVGVCTLSIYKDLYVCMYLCIYLCASDGRMWFRDATVTQIDDDNQTTVYRCQSKKAFPLRYSFANKFFFFCIFVPHKISCCFGAIF